MYKLKLQQIIEYGLMKLGSFYLVVDESYYSCRNFRDWKVARAVAKVTRAVVTLRQLL